MPLSKQNEKRLQELPKLLDNLHKNIISSASPYTKEGKLIFHPPEQMEKTNKLREQYKKLWDEFMNLCLSIRGNQP